MSNVSVLIHKLGAAPETNGVYTMKNRMMGQLQGCNDAQKQTASKSRCSETFRPYPCAGTCPSADAGFNQLLLRPKQIHVVSHTKDWALAGVEFSPNDMFVANTQQRGTGLVFANADHSTVALPHLTGEKWGTIDQDVMIVQRCGSCNYGGPPVFQVFNATSVWQGQSRDWWYMSAGNGVGTEAMGWAAMRAAYGGATFENSTPAASTRVSGNIGLNDVWSPLLLIAGAASQYGTVQNFTLQVESAPFAVTVERSRVTFDWRGRSYSFTPGPSTWKGNWTLPTINGKPIDIDPPFVYSSPHMNAGLMSDVVVASYGKYQLKYDFSDDTITRTTDRSLRLKGDDVDGTILSGPGVHEQLLQGCQGPPALAAALDDVATGSAFWITGQAFADTAEFTVRQLSSGRQMRAQVLSMTTNVTNCASSALLALPTNAGAAPYSLTVKTDGGISTPVILGVPTVDWVSAFIIARNEKDNARQCISAVYGRNLDVLIDPCVVIAHVSGSLKAVTLPVTQMTENRACFRAVELQPGIYTVKLCGHVSSSAKSEKLCSKGNATTQVVANPQPSEKTVINASGPPYNLDSSGAADVTSGLRQAIVDATRNGTQPRGVVMLGPGTFVLDPYGGIPSPLLDRCAICKLDSNFQVDLVGAGMNETKLLVGPGTDAAFAAALVGLSNLTLSDTPMPNGQEFSVNGSSIRALWTMTKLAVIPPHAATPANSTGMQEMAEFAGTDIAFRSVRFVSHRVGAGLSLRYLKRAVVEDCEFIGGNLNLWGPLADVRVEGNRGRLGCGDGTGLGCGGMIDALGWGGAGHATDFVIVRNTATHLHPLASSRFPGRFFVGQNYLLRRMYLAENVNEQAGPGALCDQNKGEQVLLEVGNTDIASRISSVNGQSLTLQPDDSPSEVLTALATRAGQNFDGSTIAVAWSYFEGLGVVSIQSGVGAGQWRTITGIDGRMLKIDRPFDVVPNVDSGLAICGSSVHDIILSANEFIGSFAKNHTTQEPHVATAALFIWANTFRYTAVRNRAQWIRATLDLFAIANSSVVDILIKDTYSVNTRYGLMLNYPLRPAFSGLTIRNLSVHGETYECGLCAYSSQTDSGASQRVLNGTAGVGVIVESMEVVSTASGLELSPGRGTTDGRLAEATLRNCTMRGHGGVGLWHNTSDAGGWRIDKLELDGFADAAAGSQLLPARCGGACPLGAASCELTCARPR